MPNRNRVGGYRWRKLVAQVVMEENGICHLCGGEGATSADHIIPIKFNSLLEFDRSNLRAVHKLCNEKRGARLLKVNQPMQMSREW